MDLSAVYEIFSLPVIIAIPFITAFAVLILSGINGLLRDIVSLLSMGLLTFLIFFGNGYLDNFVLYLSFTSSHQFELIYDTNFLSWLFGLISSGGALLITIAAIKNVRDNNYASRFHILINLVLFGILLIVYSRDLISFFAGLEIMTWASYFIITASGRNTGKSNLYYIIFNVMSAYFILLGILLLYSASGSFAFSDISKALTLISYGVFEYALLIIFLLGIIIKAGIMPMHIWLPDTYNDAPDAFTPFLSAVISKMGIYAFIVLISSLFGNFYFKLMSAPFFDSTIIGYVIAWLGVITSIIATFKAIVQEDIKKLLAYSSIAQIGYIIVALGVGTGTAVGGAIYHTVIHTIIKALLFITVAGIIHRTGKRKFHELGRLIHKMPLSFMAVLIGIIGLAGMPPLAGFSSKWLIYSSLVETKWIIILVATIIASTAAFVYCYKLIYGIFLGQPTSVRYGDAKEIHFTYWIPMLVLMGLLMFFGMFPGLMLTPVNNILDILKLDNIDMESISVLSTDIGGFNGFIVMSVFGTVFVIVFILFSFSNRAKTHHLHRLDISYAGETPTENTPLHYGYGMGKELHRIPVLGRILRRSAKRFFDAVGEQLESLFELIRGIYTGDGQKNVIFAIIFFAILVIVFLLV